MKRLLPQPLMSVTLLATWLLANNTIAPGAILLGAVLAIAIPMATARFWPEYPRTVRYIPLLRLAAVLLFDILVANVRVAVLILGPRSRLHPHFIVLPLELKHPFAITALASMITLTPGTVSANLSGDRRHLLVHGLSVRDADAAAAQIKQRYERPLMEIFE
jgi:multicomponent K+:H+ antiporter subunit E